MASAANEVIKVISNVGRKIDADATEKGRLLKLIETVNKAELTPTVEEKILADTREQQNTSADRNFTIMVANHCSNHGFTNLGIKLLESYAKRLQCDHDVSNNVEDLETLRTIYSTLKSFNENLKSTLPRQNFKTNAERVAREIALNETAFRYMVNMDMFFKIVYTKKGYGLSNLSSCRVTLEGNFRRIFYPLCGSPDFSEGYPPELTVLFDQLTEFPKEGLFYSTETLNRKYRACERLLDIAREYREKKIEKSAPALTPAVSAVAPLAPQPLVVQFDAAVAKLITTATMSTLVTTIGTEKDSWVCKAARTGWFY